MTKRRGLELISWIHQEWSKFSSLFPDGMVVMSQRRSAVVAHSYLAFTTYFCAKNVLTKGFHPTKVRRCFAFPWDSLGIQQQSELDEHFWQKRVLLENAGALKPELSQEKVSVAFNLLLLIFSENQVCMVRTWDKGYQKRVRPAHSKIPRTSDWVYETKSWASTQHYLDKELNLLCLYPKNAQMISYYQLIV